MTRQALLEKVRSLLETSAAEKGLTAQGITSDTLLLGSELGIDSLDLAGIVVQLTEETGKDPFESGFVEFRTVGELCALYEGSDGA